MADPRNTNVESAFTQYKAPRRLTPTEGRTALQKALTASGKDAPTVESRLAQYDAQQKGATSKGSPSIWSRLNPLPPVMKGIKAYSNYVSAPIAEYITINAARMFGNSAEILASVNEEDANLSRAMSEGGFGAYWRELSRQREQRRGYFWGEKIIGEIVADPFNYVGLGLAGKVPLIGKSLLGPAEALYVKGVNFLPDAGIGLLKRGATLPAKIGLGKGEEARGLLSLTHRAQRANYASRLETAVSNLDQKAAILNQPGTLPEKVRGLAMGTVTPEPLGAVPTPSTWQKLGDWITFKDTTQLKLTSDEQIIAEAGETIRRMVEAQGASPDEYFDGLMKLAPRDAAKQLASTYKKADIADILTKYRKAVADRKTLYVINEAIFPSGLKSFYRKYFEPWAIRAPAEAMLMFANYGPFNAIESYLRYLGGGGSVVPTVYTPQIAEQIFVAAQAVVPPSILSQSADVQSLVIGKQKSIVQNILGRGPNIPGTDTTPLEAMTVRLSEVGSNVSNTTGKALYIQKGIDNMHRNGQKIGIGKDPLTKEGLGIVKSVPTLSRPLKSGPMSYDPIKSMQQTATVGYYAGTPTLEGMKGTYKVGFINNQKTAETFNTYFAADAPEVRNAFLDALSKGQVTPETLDDVFKRVEDAGVVAGAKEGEAANKVLESYAFGLETKALPPTQLEALQEMVLQLSQSVHRIHHNTMSKAYTKARGQFGRGKKSVVWKGEDANILAVSEMLLGDKAPLHAIIKKVEEITALSTQDPTLMKNTANLTNFYNQLKTLIPTDTAFRDQFFSARFQSIVDELVSGGIDEEAAIGEAWRTFYAERSAIWKPFNDSQVGARMDFLSGKKERLPQMIAEALTDEQRQLYRETLGALTPENVSKMAMEGVRMTDNWTTFMGKIAEAKAKLRSTLTTNMLTPEDQIVLDSWWDSIISNRRQVEDITPSVDVGMKKALSDGFADSSRNFQINMVNADNETYFDAFAQGFFPYWRYESRAWAYLLRAGLSRPIVGRTFMPEGYYWRATDEGYIPQQISDMQFAPIRGTVLGRLRRAYRREYPPQHGGALGQFESLNNTLERAGFYLGPVPSLILDIGTSVGGALGSGTSDATAFMDSLGEYVPPLISTISAAMITGERGAEMALKAAGVDMQEFRMARGLVSITGIQETIFPSRFKDYAENMALASLFAEQGFTPSKIRFLAAKDLTRITDSTEYEDVMEAKKMLEAAQRAVAWRTIVNDQLALTRFRPEKYQEMKGRVAEEIQKLTGLTPEQQKELAAQNKRIGEAVEMNRIDRAKLAELNIYSALADVTTPLRPDAAQRTLKAEQVLWDVVNENRDRARDTQTQLDAAFYSGDLMAREWRDKSQELWAQTANIADALKNSQYFSEVPLTAEERDAVLHHASSVELTISPIDEVINAYYSVSPTTPSGEEDWAAFFQKRQDLLDALPDDVKKDVEDYLARNTTPLLREYRNGRDMMQAYWDTETFLPAWFNARGQYWLADEATKGFAEKRQAERQYNVLLRQSVDPKTAARETGYNSKRISRLDKWVTAYRKLLRDPRTTTRQIPWANAEIGTYYQRFFRDA